MTDYHQGFIAGFIPGVLLGMGLMKMAWDHEEKRRARHSRKLTPSRPEQPLAADLIRYSRWRGEQIERALRDQPPN